MSIAWSAQLCTIHDQEEARQGGNHGDGGWACRPAGLRMAGPVQSAARLWPLQPTKASSMGFHKLVIGRPPCHE